MQADKTREQLIAELERAQARVAELEAQAARYADDAYLRNVIDASPVPFALNDERQNIVHLNAAFSRTFGYTLSDIRTLSDWWSKAYPDPEYRQWVADQWQEHIDRSREMAMPFEPLELNIQCKDGSLKTVLADAAMLTGSFDAIHLVTLYDITQRKSMEIELGNALALLENVINSTPDLIFVKNHNLQTILCNDAHARAVGKTREAMYGKTDIENGWAEELVYGNPDKGIKGFIQDDQEALAGHEVHNPHDPAGVEGAIRIFDTHKLPLRDSGNKIIGVLGVARDITERTRAESELRIYRNQLEEIIAKRTAELQATEHTLSNFKAALDQTLDCVFMFEPDSLRFIYANQGAVQQLGYSEAELLGMTPVDIKPEYDEQRFRNEILRPLLDGSEDMRRFETVHRCKDGQELPVEIVVQPAVLGGKEVRFVVIVRDITERKRAEAIVEERSRQLVAAIQELESFSYSVSHDLRSPLRSINGFSLMLQEEYADRLDKTGLDYLDRVRAASKRMGLLIDNLLDLSRINRAPLNLQPVSLSALVHEVFADLMLAQPDRQVRSEIQENVVVHGDKTLLCSALENLVGNAWKYTSVREQAYIEFGLMLQDNEEVYFVRDNGVGFDMQYADKLFGAFQRLHSSDEFEGAGIGLATVQRIIHRHGGRVWAEAEPDKGATFYFTLEV